MIALNRRLAVLAADLDASLLLLLFSFLVPLSRSDLSVKNYERSKNHGYHIWFPRTKSIVFWLMLKCLAELECASDPM